LTELIVENIVKNLGYIEALKGISFKVKAGSSFQYYDHPVLDR